MAETVWCVFQRLAGDSCPSLSAICQTREVAEALVRLGTAEDERDGSAGSEWTLSRWDVLQGEIAKIEEIQQISHVLDPQREGLVPPAGEGADPPAGSGESG